MILNHCCSDRQLIEKMLMKRDRNNKTCFAYALNAVEPKVVKLILNHLDEDVRFKCFSILFINNYLFQAMDELIFAQNENQTPLQAMEKLFNQFQINLKESSDEDETYVERLKTFTQNALQSELFFRLSFLYINFNL